MQIPRHFTSLHFKIPVCRDKERRDLEMHCCCCGIILTRDKLQKRAVISQFLLLSLRPKLVTLCEFRGGWRWSVLGLLWAPILQLVTTQENIFPWKNNSFTPPILFWKVSFHLHPWMDLLCHVMCPEARDGAGWSGQGEKPSHPCGRIVSCGFAES